MSTLNQFQQQFGKPSERAQEKVRPYMIDWIQDFIRQSPFMVMATSNASGQCDAFPKGGKPGFVKVLDDQHLLIPDVAGNRLFQSYENVSTNASVGLVFLIPGHDCTARVNGTVEVVDKEQLAAMNIQMEIFNPDEHARIWQGLLLTVEEAYAHCPRAFRFSNLWDVETITRNQENPLHLP
jgi:PPOX class probable FMN-dependent enzyme